MLDEPGHWALTLRGHHQRGERQLGAHMIAHRPADDFARGKVEDRGEIEPSHPSPVVMYVMSASQTVFGAVAVNPCFSRFGAIGRSWRLSFVQGLNRRPARPRMPWWRIRRATRPPLT